MTPAQALADIRGYALAGRVEFTAHADIRAIQRGLPPRRVVEALSRAASCREERGDKWRAYCVDRDGDAFEAIVVIEDGLLVVTLF